MASTSGDSLYLLVATGIAVAWGGVVGWTMAVGTVVGAAAVGAAGAAGATGATGAAVGAVGAAPPQAAIVAPNAEIALNRRKPRRPNLRGFSTITSLLVNLRCS